MSVTIYFYLEDVWEYFIRIVKSVFGLVKPSCVPGWNNYIKDSYIASRDAFRIWKSNDSPHFGPLDCVMRTALA